MDPHVVPYDPPRNMRRDSLFHELEDGLERVANVAGRVEHYAQEVEKGAHLGRHIVEEIDAEYGGGVRSRKSASASPTYDGGGGSGGTTLHRHAASASTEKTGGKDRKGLLAEVEATQHSIDNLFDELEEIAELRRQLTGTGCTTTDRSADTKVSPGASRRAEKKLAGQIAVRVTHAAAGLLALYKKVVALSPRVEAAAVAGNVGRIASSGKRDLPKALNRVNSSFANVLDFVEDRAEEEKREIAEGGSVTRLELRIEQDHPEWYHSKILKHLRTAKDDSKWQTFAKVQPESYTYYWMAEHPFVQLDRAAVSAIDLAEHRINSRKDEKTGSWQLGSLLSRAINATHGGVTQPAKSSKTRRKAEMAVGKRSSCRHSLLSEGKGSAHLGSSDSEGGGYSDLEKQKTKLLKGSAWAVDVTKLPERVPTDDTSGYQESQAELIADAIEESKTEHVLTPLVSLFWIGIVILYGYYLIARLLGFDDPLGRVDLGETFGNDAWNDTDTTITTFSSVGGTASPSTANPTAKVASLYSLASALHSATALLPARA
ncbi:hypothetical protein JCM3774_004298 [Rhodotorula dairenensis]